MSYEFFNKGGVGYVRITVGGDTIERVATDKDHTEGEAVNAAEKAAAKEAEAATDARIAREHEVEQRLLDIQQSERKRLDAEKYAIQGRDDPTAEQLEREFDEGLANELEHRNGRHKKGKQHAE